MYNIYQVFCLILFQHFVNLATILVEKEVWTPERSLLEEESQRSSALLSRTGQIPFPIFFQFLKSSNTILRFLQVQKFYNFGEGRKSITNFF